MRIAILVRNGQAVGRRIVLRGGQIARFGRTDWADFAFPDDGSMADVHFAIHCGNDTCTIQTLAKDQPTLVNGEPVNTASLNAGDLITAGNSQFQLEVEARVSNEIATPPPPEFPQAEPEPIPDDVLALATHFGLSEEALAVAESCVRNEAFADLLIQADLLPDALRWHAHYQPKPEAVEWGCNCVQQNVQALGDPIQLAAWQAALTWAGQPTDENRQAALQLADEANMEGIGAVLAAAAGWSGGSLTPAGQTEVPPDERLTGRCVFTALMLVSSVVKPEDSHKLYHHYLGCLPQPNVRRTSV